ncbi:MAG TPA: TlyA family RNA methyltransferase [Candidatus Dormibacteraeota bacterium]|nr:TlyA family RNA methyltransferase [Candidatus Dormibacteraeota bacterium]
MSSGRRSRAEPGRRARPDLGSRGGGRRTRLDVALTEAGLAESRAQAQALVMAGRVRLEGETVHEPGRPVLPGAHLEVVARPRYVSRGGEKLAPALDHFGLRVEGRVCADVGAATGGFTDVLLQRGAARVYAVDVGRGLLHWRLRQDPRVVLMERVNARYLAGFPEPVSLITVDVSFIGLEKVLPALTRAAPGADLVVLFKPQFQVGRDQVGKRGVVRDWAAVAAALDRFRAWCAESGLRVLGELPSPLPGPEGNREILIWLRAPDTAP